MQPSKLLGYLPPDLTHDVTHLILRTYPVKVLIGTLTRLTGALPYRLRLLNRVIDSPIGIGAGIDKDGLLISLMSRLPIGFHIVGSVTLKPRRGNPKPRMRRYPGLDAMVNAMGLPSRGVDFLKGILNNECVRWPRSKLLGVSVAGFSETEFKLLLDSLTPYMDCVDFIEINVSSPTYGGSWTEPHRLNELLNSLKGYDKLVIKLPLLSSINDEVKLIKLIINHNPFGLTIANTLSIKADLPMGYGGLSGKPLLGIVINLIKLTRRIGYGGLIIGLGGFMRGIDIIKGIKAEADLIGLVTGFAMEGPLVVYRIINELRRLQPG
ncbi:dihydroorotate oxidase [Caldivirga maquilingensis]|uniref:Dihydroorotate oxidase n=1 Tax=Caldivirga maquilingensis (strain ATCC 700844 / DSM 13496 / JCM 10307 / IC-167) TaxID=397948 RepID=A8MCA1_CALMQ|nr:dihydroorotate oxidase [Caldivirga maquilingensis]ABW01407.1 Dihydroorotate oxidase [Caldivirga maquilingensis IC-167]